MDYVTSDLSKMGYAELHEVNKLIEAMEKQGLPKTFNNDEVIIQCNLRSGYVFFTNSDYQVAMIDTGDNDKLKTFYTLSYNGNEGFADDLFYEFEKDNINAEDLIQLKEILENERLLDEAEQVENDIIINYC